MEDLTNKPDAKKYFREFALAFIWHSRRQSWRIKRLENEVSQLKDSNHRLVEQGYVLQKDLLAAQKKEAK